jgi:hypothetical protein
MSYSPRHGCQIGHAYWNGDTNDSLPRRRLCPLCAAPVESLQGYDGVSDVF